MLKQYRMLSFVERWGIAPRHHHQSVTDHSYFVTLYCSQLCRLLDLTGHDTLRVLNYALRHDAFEVFISDLPGPAKRSIVDPQKLSRYHGKFADGMDDAYREAMDEADEPIYVADRKSTTRVRIRDVVKVADLMDEVFFLAMEMNLGNNLVRGLYQKELSRLDQAAVLVGGDEFAGKLMEEVGKQVTRIGEEGAVIPTNDDDLAS